MVGFLFAFFISGDLHYICTVKKFNMEEDNDIKKITDESRIDDAIQRGLSLSYNSIYEELKEVNLDRVMVMEGMIENVEEMIQFFQDLEEYEKCAFLHNILKKYKR